MSTAVLFLNLAPSNETLWNRCSGPQPSSPIDPWIHKVYKCLKTIIKPKNKTGQTVIAAICLHNCTRFPHFLYTALTIWPSHHGAVRACSGGSQRCLTAGSRVAACLTPSLTTPSKTERSLKTLSPQTSSLKALTRRGDGKLGVNG